MVFVYCQFNSYSMFITKEKLQFSLTQFLLLLSEKGLSPESCLAIFHLRASSAYKPVAYKKMCIMNMLFPLLICIDFDAKIFN